MTSSNKINILRVDHVLELSQAFIEINIGFEILLLGGRALPSITRFSFYKNTVYKNISLRFSKKIRTSSEHAE